MGKTLSANQTFMTGRPGLFAPRLLGLWSALPGMSGDVSLFDTAPLLATLHQCVDFPLLNSGAVRLTATAVDAETGDDVFFDTARTRIEAEHLRASAAFPVIYPPVEIDGRVLVDSAVSANLPLRAVSSDLPERDSVCLAIDLFAPTGRRPGTLGDAVKRGQDLIFANQARHALQDLRTAVRLRNAERLLAANAAPRATGENAAGAAAESPPHPSLTVLQVIYSEAGQESAAKMFDYSEASVQERWAAGYRDMQEALAQLGDIATPDASRFSAFRLESGKVHPL
jgi:NTE family protein